MGVYSIGSIYESYNIDDDNYVEDIHMTNDNFVEAAYKNIYENTRNYTAIMKSIGIAELSEFESTGEVLYEASSGVGVLERIKEFFKKIWEKIKALFTKFMAKLQSFGKDDKAFATKYRKQILAGSTAGLKIKGFKYDLDALTVKEAEGNINSAAISLSLEKIDKAFNGVTDIPSMIQKMISEFKVKTITNNNGDREVDGGINKYIDDVFNNKSSEDISEELRAIAIKQTGSLTVSELNDELFEIFRKGDDKPEILESSDINPGIIVNTLMNSNSFEKDIRNDLKDIKKTCEKGIRDIDKGIKFLSKGNSNLSKFDREIVGGMITYETKKSKVAQDILDIYQAISAARMKAFNDQRRQFKATAVKLIGRKPKNESYGYDYDEYDDGYDYSYGDDSIDSILGNVKLI